MAAAQAAHVHVPHACGWHSHLSAGDVAAVRRCLHEGEDIHQTVSLVNQNKQEVLGVTPLYLVRPKAAGSTRLW